MVDVTQTVIRLGNFADGIADIDPNGTGNAENAGALVNQTFTPATMSVETVTYSDGNNDGYVDFDNTVGPGGEYLTYDLGSGPVSETIDQAVWYNMDILLKDGNTVSTSGVIFQTPSGETFLTEFSSSLDNLEVQSITPRSVANSFFSRAATNRSVDNTIVCFGPGTEILTPAGYRPIDEFQPGDPVLTIDGVIKPVVAVFREAKNADTGWPIRFEAGALGVGMPDRPLYLSGNHRIFCQSKLVEKMFGSPSVLIPAKRFVDMDNVSHDAVSGQIDYTHLELNEHSVIWANGAPVESCFLGSMTVQALPQMYSQGCLDGRDLTPCLPVPKGHQQRQFVNRLIKNGKQVIDLPPSQDRCHLQVHPKGRPQEHCA